MYLISFISLEVRRMIAYRLDFWMGTVGVVGIHITVSYFLWTAVFTARGVSQIGNYSFQGMMLYAVIAPQVLKMANASQFGSISSEIYDGTLNRYLVYPVSFFWVKFMHQLAFFMVYTLQLLAALLLFRVFFGFPGEFQINAFSILLGLGAGFLATLLWFSISSCLEMVSFWADNVWSLLVMLRFGGAFLGGELIPLDLFPDWTRTVLAILPFRYLVYFPIECFLGKVGPSAFLSQAGISLVWTLSFWALGAWIWKRGTLQYSGVGI